MKNIGFVYWITGLSGAGKTSIGRLIYKKLKSVQSNTIFLDGDELRLILGFQNSYSMESRLKIAKKYSKLCNLIARQNINVVIATISMFQVVRDWNKSNIKNYREIYIKVPIDVLIQRDQKNIYSKAKNGQIKNVMGLDIEFEEPNNPDIICSNDGSKSVKDLAISIYKELKKINRNLKNL